MTHIMGVVCDACGKNDVISAQVASTQSVPRRNWMSLSVWSGDDKGAVRTPEIHVCSAECLEVITSRLVDSATERNAENSEE